MKKKIMKRTLALALAGAMIASQLSITPADTVEAENTTTLTSSAKPQATQEPVLLSEVEWIDLNNLNTGYGVVSDGATQSAVSQTDDTYGNYKLVTKTYHADSKELTIGYQPSGTTDITGAQYLEFGLYIPTETDLTLFKSGTWLQLELSSSGASDNCEIYFELSDLGTLKQGWNSVKLALNEATSSGGIFDSSGLNYFRMYISPTDSSWTTGATFSLGITKFRFTKYNTVTFTDKAYSVTASADSTTFAPSWTRSTGIDITNMDYMEFDIYLSDPSILTSAGDTQIELRSSDGNDNNELQWTASNVKNMKWVTGWNHVKLALSGATIKGTVDTTAINYFRFYMTGAASGTTCELKNLRFTRELEDETLIKEHVINECGNGKGMAGAIADAFHYSNADASYNNTDSAFSYSFNSVDVRGYQYVEFDLWLADVTSALSKDKNFEFSSNGEADSMERSISAAKINSLGLVNGWNHVKLSLAEFTNSSSDGDINWADVNYFRLYFAGYTGGKAIDNVRLTAYDTQDTTTPVKILLTKADSTNNYAVAGESTMALDETESCLTFTRSTTTGNNGTLGFRYNTAMQYKYRYDLTNAKYLEFDLWTEDTNLFQYSGDKQIQIFSGSDSMLSKENDATRRMAISSSTLSNISLSSGWNHIKLELPTSYGEKFNIQDVRGLRFYITNLPDDTVVKLKNFYATSDVAVEGTYPLLRDKEESTVTYAATWQISDCYATDVLTCGGAMSNAMVGMSENGGNYYAATLAGSYTNANVGTISCAKNITTIGTEYNASQLALALQLYIEDVNTFQKYKDGTGGQIELSSNASNIDTNDLYWNMNELHLQSGWNELVLPFDKASYTGEFDQTNIQQFRLYLAAFADMIVAVDDIKIVVIDENTTVTDVSIYPEGYWLTEAEANTADGVGTGMYENGFTMVALPDLQEITGSHSEMLGTMFNYIANTKDQFNTQFVLGLGDITWMGHYGMASSASASDQQGAKDQFVIARNAFKILDDAGIRYSNSYGNHDFTPAGSTGTGVQDTSLFNENFKYSDYVGMTHYGAANTSTNYKATTWGVYQEGSMDNTYYKVNAGGIKYLVLALEFLDDPNPELMTWANKVVAAHPNYNVIVTTHGYLNATENGNNGELLGDDSTYGKYLWNQLVSKHNNILMVLSGHVINDADEGSHLRLLGTRPDGNTVYQYMFNSQDADTYYGGLGMITLMHFSEDGTKVTFRYYSPVQEAYYKASNQFTIDVTSDMSSVMQGDANDDDTVDVRDVIRTKTYTDNKEEVYINKWVFGESTVGDTSFVRNILVEQEE